MPSRTAAVAALVVLLTFISSAHAEYKKPRATQADLAMVTVKAAVTVDTMVDKINTSYMLGLRRCYNKALAEDSSLRGKITLLITIGAEGEVSGNASGISNKVETCVGSLMKSWRFGKPDNRRESTFQISLLLAR